MNEQDKTPRENGEDKPGETPETTEATGDPLPEPANQETGEADAAQAAEEQAEAPGEPAAASLEAEVAALKERLLRALAETENLRARAERERQDTAKYAITGFARDMITIADNLRHAIASIPEAARQDESLKTLIEGIEVTERALLQALEKHGIRRIDPLGEKFDHNFHQAMFEVESGEREPGTVAEVVQAGFTIHDRLLRPAMVGVAKARKGAQNNGDPGKTVDTVA